MRRRYFERHEFTGRPFAMQQKMYRDGGATLSVGNVAIPIPLGVTVGGTTTVNSGTCLRTIAAARSSTVMPFNANTRASVTTVGRDGRSRFP